MSQNSPKKWFNLEENFFNDLDQKLLEKIRNQQSAEQNAEAIMRITGITDKALAEELASVGVSPETLTAFRLAPMVAVAWADDRVEDNERYVILQAAEKSGIKSDDPAMSLLNEWTRRRPSDELLNAWCDYAKALSMSLNGELRSVLKKEIIAQIHAVAHATGGLLGYGSTSPSEKAVMKRIEDALQ